MDRAAFSDVIEAARQASEEKARKYQDMKLKRLQELLALNQAIPASYSKPGAVLEWALRQIVSQKELPAGYSITHAGKCCRCARQLTEPVSLETGIGPECRKKVGMVA